jgi:hypothetical protein
VKTSTAALRLIEDLADRALGTVSLEKNSGNGREVMHFRLHSADGADSADRTQSARFCQAEQQLAHSADSADAPTVISDHSGPTS